MSLDDTIRERVVFLGGKAAGVECPNCQYRGRDVDLDVHTFTNVTCPECGATVLTEDEKAQLRQADKL